MCLGTLIIRFVNTEWQLILVYLAAGLGTNVAFAIFSALLPDNVPIEQRGTASSWSAFFSAIGNLSGGIVPGIVIQRVGLAACTYIIAAIIAAGTAVVVVFARDEPYRPSRRNDSVGHCTSRQDSANEEGSNLIEATNFTFENSDRISASRTRQPSDRSGCWVSLLRATLRRLWKILFRPFDSRDFVCGYFCNVFFIASALTLSEFLQFYFQDEVKTFSIFTVIHLRSSNTAVSVWNGISSTVSIFFTILAGIYAYRVGFRWLLITGSIITGLGLGVTMATTDYPGALVAGVVYGIGNGLGFTGLFGLLAGIVHNPQRAAVVLEIDEVTPSEIESLIHSEHGKSSNQQTATDACIDAQDVGDVTTQAEPKDGNCNHDSDSDNGNASSLGVLNMATGLSQVLASLVNGQVLAGFTEHHWIDGRDSSYGMETGYRVVFGLGITYALLAALFTFFVRKVR
jgi:MFS family permease